MFQKLMFGATSTPERLFRYATGATYWPRWTCVGASAARRCTASGIAFCFCGSVSLAKASRSRSISASHGPPKVALGHLALRDLRETGSRTSADDQVVTNACQPPAEGGSFFARRET